MQNIIPHTITVFLLHTVHIRSCTITTAHTHPPTVTIPQLHRLSHKIPTTHCITYISQYNTYHTYNAHILYNVQSFHLPPLPITSQGSEQIGKCVLPSLRQCWLSCTVICCSGALQCCPSSPDHPLQSSCSQPCSEGKLPPHTQCTAASQGTLAAWGKEKQAIFWLQLWLSPNKSG